MASKLTYQSAPVAATETIIRTATGQEDIIGIFICNRSTLTDQFTISLVIGGGATNNVNIIYPTCYIVGLDVIYSVGPIFMNTNDELKVTSLNGTCSFTVSIYTELWV